MAVALAVWLVFVAVPAFAAGDQTDTVVLGVEGNETFTFYKERDYEFASTPADALAKFNLDNGARFTRLLILKNAASVTGQVSEWTWQNMTTLPGNLRTIEGGSLTKPYEVILHGVPGTPIFDLTGVGSTEKPVVFKGLTLTGGEGGIEVDGDSTIEVTQCYIRENRGSADSPGVAVRGSASANLTNCAFYMNQDGIVIDGTDATATIRFCTFYDNNGSGIHALNGGTASVVNTLMYTNGAHGIWDESSTCSVSTSNSQDNTAGNYTPASLASGNYSEIVEFASPTRWRGKMWTSSIINLALTRGAVIPTIAIDLEGEGRSSTPYIGADELNLDATTGFWTHCEVYGDYVGGSGADVLINYSGSAIDLADSLCLVPDGVSPLDLAHDIPVELEGGDGIYWGRIPELAGPIIEVTPEKTYIYDSDDAQFVLRLTNGELLDVNDDNRFILGQAVPGHKGVKIDTIPPVVNVDSYTSDTIVSWGVVVPGEAFGASGISFVTNQPGYPFPYPAIGGFPQMLAGAVPSCAVFTPSPPEPPLYVYNVGSVANGYDTLLAEHWLFLKVQATFADPDVYEYADVPQDGYTRTPSGFDTVALGDASGTAAEYLTEAVLAAGLPAAWRVENGNLTPLGAATVDFSTTVSGTSMTATWDIAIPVVGASGPLRNRLDLFGDFVGQDKAGNFPAASEIDRAVVPPLRISWLSGVDTELSFTSRMYGSWPEFTWHMKDTQLQINPGPDNPKPIYTFNIWGARTYGFYNGDPIYEQLTGWSPWDPGNGLSASFFDQNLVDNFGTSIMDRWLIMVVAGCDEAGNVTPWDGYQWPLGSEPSSLLLNGDGSLTLLNFDQESGRNWIRFYIPGKTTQIDTVLYANLYYLDDTTGARRDLGPAPIVSYPPPGVRLFAEFNGRLLVNDPALWNGSHWVGLKFSVDENGVPLFLSPGFRYVESTGSDVVGFMLPYADASAGVTIPVQLGAATNVMTYTVGVATVVDLGPEYQLEDQTPSTFSFKVVPGSVDEYLRSSGGQQPVKQFETR